MRKLFLTLAAVCTLVLAQAQDLSTYVPSDAFAITKINGKSLNNKAAVSTLSGLPVMGELFHEFDDVKSFDEIGFNLRENMYLFAQKSDSMTTGFILIPLLNRSKFEANFLSNYSKEELDAGLIQEGEMVTRWDDQKIIIAITAVNENYLAADSLFEQKHGFRYSRDGYWDSGYNEEIIEETYVYEEVAEAADYNINEYNVTLLTDFKSLQSGQELYNAQCAVCHKLDGSGLVGSNLTDNYWSYSDGTINGIYRSISEGVEGSGMIAYKNNLSPKEIQMISSYILALEEVSGDEGKAPEGDYYSDYWIDANHEAGDVADARDAAKVVDAAKDAVEGASENDPMNTYWENGVEYYMNGEPVEAVYEESESSYYGTTEKVEAYKVEVEEYNGNNYYQKMDSLTSAWLMVQMDRLNSAGNQKNMSKDIQDVIHTKSDVGVYVDYGQAMGSYMNMLYSMTYVDHEISQMMHSLTSIYGGVKLKANMNFNEDNVHIDADYIMGDRVVDIYDGLMDRKFNKKFLKHMDLDNMIAYYSMSLNSESIIKMYPKVLGLLLDDITREEGFAQPIADLLAVTLDEKALGDVMTGNMVLLCDGFSQQKMTYISYDYDENFERVEVAHESEELLPSILMMVETKNPKLIKSFINILQMRDFVTATDYGFVIPPNSDLPVGVHIIFKDEIIYICNDENRMKNIVAGISTGTKNKRQKKLLTKNNSTLFIDAQKAFEAIPYAPYSERDQQSYDLLKSRFQDVSISQYQKDKNTISSRMDFNIPAGSGNSWMFLWESLNDFFVIESQRY